MENSVPSARAVRASWRLSTRTAPPARLTPWSATLERASTPDSPAVVTAIVDWLSTLTARTRQHASGIMSSAAASLKMTRPYLAVDVASGRSLEREWAWPAWIPPSLAGAAQLASGGPSGAADSQWAGVGTPNMTSPTARTSKPGSASPAAPTACGELSIDAFV
jgi:hypothetical protein